MRLRPSTFWIPCESKVHMELDQACLIWFEERIHLRYWFRQILSETVPQSKTDSSCPCLRGLRSISSRSKKFLVHGKQALPSKGRNKDCSDLFALVSFALSFATAAFKLRDFVGETGWLQAVSVLKQSCGVPVLYRALSEQWAFLREAFLRAAADRKGNDSCLPRRLVAGVQL